MSIEDQLKQAAQAAQSTNTASQGTAVAEAAQSAPAVVGKRIGRQDFQNNAAGNVGTYLKVSEHGLTFGKEAKKLVDKFSATIDLSKVKYCQQVRFGNPAQYYKTLDGVTTQGTGKPWTVTLQQAKQIDSGRSSDPYATAEIVMVTSAPVKSVKNEDVVEAGTVVGYTPPYTGADAFNQLIKDVEAAGIDPDRGVVDVEVGYIDQHRNGNNWGIVTFKLLKAAA